MLAPTIRHSSTVSSPRRSMLRSLMVFWSRDEATLPAPAPQSSAPDAPTPSLPRIPALSGLVLRAPTVFEAVVADRNKRPGLKPRWKGDHRVALSA